MKIIITVIIGILTIMMVSCNIVFASNNGTSTQSHNLIDDVKKGIRDFANDAKNFLDDNNDKGDKEATEKEDSWTTPGPPVGKYPHYKDSSEREECPIKNGCGEKEGNLALTINLNYKVEKIGKALISASDGYKHNYDISDKPSQIKIKGLDILDGQSFETCILNKATQHSDCSKGNNNNDKATVSLDVK